MSRSQAAFIIAMLVHLLLLLLFWMFGAHLLEPKKLQNKEQQRIKVSLKENPKATKESFEKNQIKDPKIAPPMPKGKQLEKLIEKPFLQPKVQETPPKPINPPKPKPKPTPKKVAPLPPEKPYIPLAKKTTEHNQSKSRLYSFLSQEVANDSKAQHERQSGKRESRIAQDLREAYGDEFGKLSEGEQKYLLDNQEIMRRITQEVLNRVGSVNLPDNLRVNRHNIIEFYLYPNGDISEIKFIENSGFYILDDTTKETIEYAYSRYPRPQQKTLIRYKVGYYLRGY